MHGVISIESIIALIESVLGNKAHASAIRSNVCTVHSTFINCLHLPSHGASETASVVDAMLRQEMTPRVQRRKMTHILYYKTCFNFRYFHLILKMSYSFPFSIENNVLTALQNHDYCSRGIRTLSKSRNIKESFAFTLHILKVS